MKFVLLSCIFLCIFYYSWSKLLELQIQNVHYLEQDETYTFEPLRYSNRQLHIFCFEGKPKYILHIWRSVVLKIFHSTDDYNQFDGFSPEDVKKEYQENSYSWSFGGIFSTKSKELKLDPFNTSCIGIDSRDKYSVHLQVIRFDVWKFLCLSLGIFLFFSAPKLSHNSLFHYLCGISFGICASFLILIYLVSKLFPKFLMYGSIATGWTIGLYFLQRLWDNLRLIMSMYQNYVLWYILSTGLISFIVCYRYGQVTNPRTINLIKWSLQVMALLVIFFSSQYQEASMGIIIFILVVRFMPKRWVMATKKYWKKRFPPKVKPLSNDEYYEQGVRETAKALEELREYCSSPKCNQWKTALKIKDVKRFASFIEGNSHLSDEEILDYETSIHGEISEDEFSVGDPELSDDSF